MVERDPTDAAVTDALNELEEDGLIDTEHERGEEPKHSLTEEGVEHAEETIREKASAKLFLLSLHWNNVCVEQESMEETLEELFRFVAKVRDDMGVNLLRVHHENRDSVEQDPIPEFGEETLQRFDPRNDRPQDTDTGQGGEDA